MTYYVIIDGKGRFYNSGSPIRGVSLWKFTLREAKPYWELHVARSVMNKISDDCQPKILEVESRIMGEVQ